MVTREIPKQLQQPWARFILLEGKHPIEKDWPNKFYRYDDPKLTAWMGQGKNIGVLCGGLENLMIVDCDNPIIRQIVMKIFPKTFWVHEHAYFFCKGAESYKVIEGNETYCDIQFNGRQCVTCPSVHPTTGKPYEVVQDCEISQIDWELVKYILPRTDNALRDIKATQILGFVPTIGTKITCRIFQPDQYVLKEYLRHRGSYLIRFKNPAFITEKIDQKTAQKLVYLELPFLSGFQEIKGLISDEMGNILNVEVRRLDRFNFKIRNISRNNLRNVLGNNLGNDSGRARKHTSQYINNQQSTINNSIPNGNSESSSVTPTIRQKEVKALKSAIPISKVLQHYGSKIKYSKECFCPLHQEKNPSGSFDDATGKWFCHHEGRGGDSFALIMELDKVGFPDAVKKLEFIGGKYG